MEKWKVHQRYSFSSFVAEWSVGGVCTNGVKVKMKRRFFRLKTDWKILDSRILLLTDLKINIWVQNYVFFFYFQTGKHY